jgi:hypothetical protein
MGRKILLLCDANRCPPEEILEPLGMTLADICAGDDVDDLDEYEPPGSPGQMTAHHRRTATLTAGSRDPSRTAPTFSARCAPSCAPMWSSHPMPPRWP